MPIGILVLLLGGAAGYLWLQGSGTAFVPARGQSVSAPIQQADEQRIITLAVPGSEGLAAVQASVRSQPDTQAEARETLALLLADPRSVQSPVLGAVKVRAFFIDASRTAFLDMSPVSQTGIRASANDELLAVYSFVNTLTQFEEIRQVRFLIDGREAQTLAGHVDVSGPLARRTDLLKQY